MTQQLVRAAVIGLGRMGSTYDDESGAYSHWQPPHTHTACYLASPEIQLVGGSDPHPDQRRDYIGKWDFNPAHVYADFKEMLERERPEIVSICTSAKPRASILLDVVAANTGVKAIWAEKPLSISLAEADQMVEACRRAGILLAVGASRCWDATYNRMRELIDLGEIGQVLQVNGFGNCMLSHNGSHLLTLVNYLAGGRCSWVFGHLASDEIARTDDDFQGNAYLQYDNGVQGYIRSMPCGAAEWDFEVIGTQGRLRAVNDGEEVEFWKLAAPTLPGRRREPVRQIFPRPMPMLTANYRTVLDLLVGLRTGKEPICNGDAARHALEIAVAIRESHRRGGQRVNLPLADRSLRINSSETLRGDDPVMVQRRRAAQQ